MQLESGSTGNLPVSGGNLPHGKGRWPVPLKQTESFRLSAEFVREESADFLKGRFLWVIGIVNKRLAARDDRVPYVGQTIQPMHQCSTIQIAKPLV